MKWATIKGFTHAPGAPRGWDPKTMGSCGALPVKYDAQAFGGAGECVSAWQPTAEELAQLNAGGFVLMSVVGWQVPVMLSVAGSDAADA